MYKLSSSEKILCVFCKLPHRVYKKNDVSLFDAFVLLLISGLFMFLVWGEPDKRSLILFGVLIFSMQVFIRMRWRESVKCPHCGFDPVLYKVDNESAAEKVQTFLQDRKTNPKFLLKPKPQIKPIVKKVEWSLNSLQPIETKEEALESPSEKPEKGGVDFVL